MWRGRVVVVVVVVVEFEGFYKVRENCGVNDCWVINGLFYTLFAGVIVIVSIRAYCAGN